MLAQTSVERLRTNGYAAQLVAVRLPYGKQIDEEDALLALATIKPDRAVTINIKPATDALLCETRNQAGDLFDTAKEDFHCGNIKARQRMVVQYALAASIDGLVIGTSHAAEALMGSFTKFGNNAADIFPLSNLNKRQIKAIASYLYAPISLVLKPPTGDLESSAPLRTDEEIFGVTYESIDDFLEGKTIDQVSRQRIIAFYTETMHKRAVSVELPCIGSGIA